MGQLYYTGTFGHCYIAIRVYLVNLLGACTWEVYTRDALSVGVQDAMRGSGVQDMGVVGDVGEPRHRPGSACSQRKVVVEVAQAWAGLEEQEQISQAFFAAGRADGEREQTRTANR